MGLMKQRVDIYQRKEEDMTAEPPPRVASACKNAADEDVDKKGVLQRTNAATECLSNRITASS
jgi:hypothetical protein